MVSTAREQDIQKLAESKRKFMLILAPAIVHHNHHRHHLPILMIALHASEYIWGGVLAEY